MIYVGTGVTMNYLEKAMPYLLSLQKNAGIIVEKFCITVGFHIPEAYKKLMPDIKFHYLSPYHVENMNDNFCIQQGAFMHAEGFNPDPDDVVIFTDSDIFVQRDFTKSECDSFKKLQYGDVMVNHNANRYDSLLSEAYRLKPTVDISIIQQIVKSNGGNMTTLRCFNTGCVVALASTWESIEYVYDEIYPIYGKLFEHYAKQQWILSLLMQTRADGEPFIERVLQVIDLPLTTHSHGKYGVSPEIEFKGTVAYRDKQKLMFRHALYEPFKRVCLVIKGMNGCGYYRGMQWIEMLKAKYFDKIQYSVCPNGIDEQALNDADIIFLHNSIDNKIFFEVMKQKAKGKLIIYDADDDYFNVDDENAGGVGFKKPEVESTVLSFMKNANIITVSTQYIKDRYIERLSNPNTPKEEVAKRISIKQNNVDFKNWSKIKEVHDTKEDDGITRIGWQGGSSHVKDMRPFVRMMERFLKKHSDVHFCIVGETFMSMFEDKSILPQVELVGWVDDSKNYGYNITQFDIGIAPLADLTFNASKSNLKWLEYSAMGIPTIATKSEPYKTIEDGVTGILIDGKWDGKTNIMPKQVERDWFEAMELLINDKDKRNEIGMNAYKYVKENYDAYAYADEWAHTLGIKEE